MRGTRTQTWSRARRLELGTFPVGLKFEFEINGLYPNLQSIGSLYQEGGRMAASSVPVEFDCLVGYHSMLVLEEGDENDHD